MDKEIKIFGNLSYNVAERIVNGFIELNKQPNNYSDARLFGKTLVVETESNYVICLIEKK